MPIKLGVIMDPIHSINPKKDSTLALLMAAQHKNWEISYMELGDLFLDKNQPKAFVATLQLQDDLDNYYQFSTPKTIQNLSNFDVILMRKDPPITESYLYATFILERAENQGCLIANKPASLRDYNEKIAASLFPELIPSTLVTSAKNLLEEFVIEHGETIFKPLNAMGGQSIFYVKQGDKNIHVIIESLTYNGSQPIMAQRYIPEIKQGDKRILMINGTPFPYALARIPKPGEHRGNLAAGGEGHTQPLSARDQEICTLVGPFLKEKGIIFAGIDVIGDYLTEINITSPTCVRELSSATGENIAMLILECIEGLLHT